MDDIDLLDTFPLSATQFSLKNTERLKQISSKEVHAYIVSRLILIHTWNGATSSLG
jgi:hypothetical protein